MSNPQVQNEVTRLMNQKISTWPAPLRLLARLVVAKYGFSGGVLPDTCEMWIKDGKPQSAERILALADMERQR
jgi:hypothetical protein